ncbi:type IV secretory system conjugative DNA transfer family protein [Comamonas thiooxydans]|uniref:type IV secretory system conjugative DNA transfer family protein n=1 Tax=Comamonas thiooxydans TaxID=363952 RepID=UPI000B41776B|nr:TraM recognition domain-containing protein [Comamonas thiooxydans]
MPLRTLLGREDFWPIAAPLAVGVGATHPLFAGSPIALAATAAAGVGAYKYYQAETKRRMRTVDEDAFENFSLPSDDTFDENLGLGGLRIGFTKDRKLPVDIENDKLMRHLAIVGQSGVGKTVLGMNILWQQTARGGGWLFIDAKLDKDVRDQLAYMTRIFGREDEFYVMNVNEPENSNTYNPLLNGDPDEIASRLLNLLPSSDNNPGSDFYKQSANYALTVLVGALQAANKRYTFMDLAIMLQSAAAIGKVETLVPLDSQAFMVLQVFLDTFKKKDKNGVQVDTEKLKQILGGMSGRIAQFAQGKFGKVFNTTTPEIDLTEIVRHNKMCYVMLPTMAKDTAAQNLGKMILSDLRTAIAKMQELTKSERPNPPFICFADEMGSYVMPGISRVFEQARSAGVMMIPAFQTFANLASVSPEFEEMIIGNTWTKCFFKLGSIDSATKAADLIGQQKNYVHSVSSSKSESASAQSLRVTPESSQSESGGVGESWRQQEEYRISPDKLLRMGVGECVMCSGPRTFHISTQAIAFPPVPEFKKSTYPTSLPAGFTTLNLEGQYEKFLIGMNINTKEAANKEEAIPEPM